jgi:hypothetical protein
MTNIAQIVDARVYLDEPTDILTDGTVMNECTLEGMIYYYYRNQVGLEMFEASRRTTKYIAKLSRMFDEKENV